MEKNYGTADFLSHPASNPHAWPDNFAKNVFNFFQALTEPILVLRYWYVQWYRYFVIAGTGTVGQPRAAE